jgi:hypothetical protein
VFTSGFAEADGVQPSADEGNSVQDCWEEGSDSDLSDSDIDCDSISSINDTLTASPKAATADSSPTARTRKVVHIRDTA